MEIIVKGIEDVDVPVTKEGEEYEKLQKAMEKNIRQKLELRSTDEVTFQIQKSSGQIKNAI